MRVIFSEDRRGVPISLFSFCIPTLGDGTAEGKVGPMSGNPEPQKWGLDILGMNAQIY